VRTRALPITCLMAREAWRRLMGYQTWTRSVSAQLVEPVELRVGVFDGDEAL